MRLGLSLGATQPTGASFTPVIESYSVGLDGTNDYVDVGTSSTLNPADLTISAWIKPASLSNWKYIMTRGLGGWKEAYRFQVGEDDLFCAFGNGTSNDEISRAHGMSTGTWYHVVVTYDGSTAALYKNGARLGATESISIVMESASEDTVIGRPVNTGGSYFHGNISEVGFWNVALDADAITTIYNSGKPFKFTRNKGDYDNASNLVSWWRMGESDGGTGTTVTDLAGSNNGTLTNGAAFSTDTP